VEALPQALVIGGRQGGPLLVDSRNFCGGRPRAEPPAKKLHISTTPRIQPS
jgi:hypothetical protein